ncbi:hypothetical protein [Roseitalea porphyridii]|uniref:Uncharacterized protein n=1 Tax=Roseitalea porphyridii TaxID=1852022 RepID=A0A4P6V148_9HYPH|nr:hypothetical protein [Roseitalea porphyridii]QBK30394.1 hypothetical protein E0E05_07150 [Roseitalea porphyridii]
MPQEAVDELEVERLKKMSSEMIDAISSPAFVEAMRKLKETPVEDRLKVGAKLLDPKRLRKEGVPLPDDMRISSRYFEPGKPVISVDDAGAFTGTRSELPNDPDVVAVGGCACGGGLSFCGGAGGST